MKKKLKWLLIAGCLLLISSNLALAQGLVPCGNPGQRSCNLCDFLVLVKNVITFFLEAGVALAALFFAWGTFVIMTAGGSEQRVSEGRKVITTVVIGVLISFTAWLIVGTALQILTDSPSKLPWTQIQCTLK